jgi:hypothetical protein
LLIEGSMHLTSWKTCPQGVTRKTRRRSIFRRCLSAITFLQVRPFKGDLVEAKWLLILTRRSHARDRLDRPLHPPEGTATADPYPTANWKTISPHRTWISFLCNDKHPTFFPACSSPIKLVYPRNPIHATNVQSFSGTSSTS